MARPVEQLVNVVHGELRGRGGVELHISRPGRGTYRLWISDRELPEVIRKLSTAQSRAPASGARRDLAGTGHRAQTVI